jgi:hypothetical protein
MTEQSEHAKMVTEFLRERERSDPQTFRKVCDKYPVLSREQWRSIHQREKPQGLLANDED